MIIIKRLIIGVMFIGAGNYGYSGNTPPELMMKAVEEGNIEIVSRYIDGGIDVNALINNCSALQKASEKGHLALVKYLISRGARVNLSGGAGWTPLMEAAGYGHVEIVKYLLDKGADRSARMKFGWTAFDVVCGSIYGKMEIALLVIPDNYNPNRHSQSVNSSLAAASGRGFADIVQFLLDRGANVNDQSNGGNTALMLAADSGHVEIMKMLLKHGANPGIKNNEGKTAFDLAMLNHKIDAANILHPGKYLIKWVSAKSGLRLREFPSTDARSIITLKYGENIVVLGEQGKGMETKIDGVFGRWLKIYYHGAEGWVFSGFLSDEKISE